MYQKAAKKPAIVVHNKVGWVSWILTLALGIVFGGGIILYSLRPNEVRAVFHTEPTTQAAADSSLSNSTNQATEPVAIQRERIELIELIKLEELPIGTQ